MHQPSLWQRAAAFSAFCTSSTFGSFGKPAIPMSVVRSCAALLCACACCNAFAQAAMPPAQTQLTVNVGEKKALWVQGNYSVLCRSNGPPTFTVTTAPTLGEVFAEWGDYTVPAGQRCETMVFPGMIVWYRAGTRTGTDTVVFEIGFPRELTSRVPGTGEHTVTTTVTIQ